ncbi:MAG: carboxypeptidase regulatory-like domain-containing protein [Flavobacteriales bacterium]|nr:carboxypeptidase regulatory-like domain-containing protein [Flavobacteriales bacterium]
MALSSIILLSSCASVYLQEGLKSYENLQMQDAIKHLEKGLDKKEDGDAREALAEAYVITNQPKKAAYHYEQLALINAENDGDRIEYAKALMGIEEYAKAEEILNGVLSRDPGNEMAQNLKASCRRIEDWKKEGSLFSVDSLSTTGLEYVYGTVMTSDGAIVTGAEKKLSARDPYTSFGYTNLYKVNIDGENISNAEPFDLNGRYHDASPSLSADESFMVFTRNNYDNGNRLNANTADESTMQLYFTEKDEEGNWKDPAPLSFMDPDYMFAHPALSDDGNTLYFSSNMNGGFGGMDLWYATKTDSAWTKPVNLGSKINSKGDEVFPNFNGSDTLYFSSDGMLTMGGLDVLYLTKNNDDWGSPVHLPAGVNSPQDDFNMVHTSAKYGYFSSNRNGRDGIFSFERFDPEITLRGLVTDALKGEPLDQTTVIINNTTDGTIDSLVTDEVGMFELNLLPGKEYKIQSEKEGYFKDITDVDTRDILVNEEIDFNASLLPLSNPEDTADNQDGGSGDGDGSGSGDGDGSGSGDGDAPETLSPAPSSIVAASLCCGPVGFQRSCASFLNVRRCSALQVSQ